MCDVCDTARTQPTTKKALDLVAKALQDKRNRGRDCLDELVGELALGTKPKKSADALDYATETLKDRP